RVGRAVVGNRLLLLLDLARLDRQGDLARRAVDGGDLGIDLLADREALGTLVGTVAGELRLADEAVRAVAEIDLDAIVLHGRDGRGHEIAALDLRRRTLLERIGRQLLDAERDTLLLDVD